MARESRLAVRIYYEDVDAGGVVYYANYLKYFERGRTEMLRELGYDQDKLIHERDVIFAVTWLQADYISPARFNDLVIVLTRLKELKPASLVFEQQLGREADGTVLCNFESRVACLRASTLKPAAIPGDIVASVQGK